MHALELPRAAPHELLEHDAVREHRENDGYAEHKKELVFPPNALERPVAQVCVCADSERAVHVEHSGVVGRDAPVLAPGVLGLREELGRDFPGGALRQRVGRDERPARIEIGRVKAGQAVAASAPEHANLSLVAHAARAPEILQEACAKNARLDAAFEHVVDDALHFEGRLPHITREEVVGVVAKLRRFIEHLVEARRILVAHDGDAPALEILERRERALGAHDHGRGRSAARIRSGVGNNGSKLAHERHLLAVKESRGCGRNVDFARPYRPPERFGRVVADAEGVLRQLPAEIADRLVDKGAVVPGGRIGKHAHADAHGLGIEVGAFADVRFASAVGTRGRLKNGKREGRGLFDGRRMGLRRLRRRFHRDNVGAGAARSEKGARGQAKKSAPENDARRRAHPPEPFLRH